MPSAKTKSDDGREIGGKYQLTGNADATAPTARKTGGNQIK
jgi:hypothetical protein